MGIREHPESRFNPEASRDGTLIAYRYWTTTAWYAGDKRSPHMAIENFGYCCTLKSNTFALAKETVLEALEAEGFAVISEIDMQDALRKSLEADFRRYLILGVWQPELAYEALGAEAHAGLLFPCNVVLQDRMGAEGVVVSLQNPTVAAEKTHNHELVQVSRKIDGLMQKVLLSLGGTITGKHPAGLEDVIPLHPGEYRAKGLKSKLDDRRIENSEV